MAQLSIMVEVVGFGGRGSAMGESRNIKLQCGGVEERTEKSTGELGLTGN